MLCNVQSGTVDGRPKPRPRVEIGLSASFQGPKPAPLVPHCLLRSMRPIGRSRRGCVQRRKPWAVQPVGFWVVIGQGVVGVTSNEPALGSVAVQTFLMSDTWSRTRRRRRGDVAIGRIVGCKLICAARFCQLRPLDSAAPAPPRPESMMGSQPQTLPKRHFMSRIDR